MGYMWLGLGQDQIQGQVRHRRLAVTRAPLTSKVTRPRVGLTQGRRLGGGTHGSRTVRSGRRVWTGTSSELSSEHYPGNPAEGQRLGQWPWKGETGASSPSRIIAGGNPENRPSGRPCSEHGWHKPESPRSDSERVLCGPSEVEQALSRPQNQYTERRDTAPACQGTGVGSSSEIL